MSSNGELWMLGLMRPLEDHEWELILEDNVLQETFPQVEKEEGTDR